MKRHNCSIFVIVDMLVIYVAIWNNKSGQQKVKRFTFIYTHTKLIYFGHPNKNIDHSDLRITRILVQ